MSLQSYEENPYPALNSYSVYTKQEYAHYDSDVVRLGNNETVWITISASPATLTADDFYFEYDDTMLNIIDISEELHGNNKEIILSIKAKKSGVSEILIASLYEIYEYYDEASCYTIVINGLDQNEGRVVYVASTGEKYHYSSNCISSGIKTTLDDAVTLEYGPCGKCVG